jgi:hypothetical protein
MYIKCKLKLLEPWKFGTDKAVDAIIVEANENQILISIMNPLNFDNQQVEFFLAELKDKNYLVGDENFMLPGIYPINMVFSKEISPQNFKSLNLKDFRSNFLLGEIVIL